MRSRPPNRAIQACPWASLASVDRRHPCRVRMRRPCPALECPEQTLYGAGSYGYYLSAVDTYGASDLDTVVVTIIEEPNDGPISNAGEDASYTIAHDGDPLTDCVTFDLTGSANDTEGDPLSSILIPRLPLSYKPGSIVITMPF